MNPESTRQFPDFVSRRDSVETQAAAWSDALRDGDAPPELRRAFDAWYAADPEHARHFDEIDYTYRLARAASGVHAPAAMEAEIIHRAGATRRRRRRYLATAASLVVAVAAGFVVTDTSWQQVRYLPEKALYALAGDSLYRTAVGERLTVSLDDGSVLTLNTDSRAVVRYGDQRRDVELTHGQALFEVARDKSRPFVVEAAGRRVTALGTAFDVRVVDNQFAVTLIEGSVEVTEEKGAGKKQEEDSSLCAPPCASVVSSSESRVLSPGQRYMVATATEVPVIQTVDLNRAISWRNGHVIFENDPLADVVSEINRYSRRRVVLASDAIGDVRVSGAFNTGNATVFVDMLTLHFPVTIIEATNDRIVLGSST